MAYGTDTGLQNYATARGYTLEKTPSILLTLAHDYIESLRYIGAKTVATQPDQWPRKGVNIDGIDITSVTVPQDIIDAEYQLAIAIDNGNDPTAVITPAIKEEEIANQVRVEYQDGQGNRSFDPKVLMKLRKYLVNGTVGIGNIGVIRG